MDRPEVRFYEFGDFRFDVRRRTLSKNDDLIPISSRISDLLTVFLQNEGRTLSHDELMDAVWTDSFVEQSNLKKSVSSLRHVLGEGPNEAQYIKTIPRRGYCFVAEVRAVVEEAPETALADDPSAPDTVKENDSTALETGPRSVGFRGWYALVGILVVCVAAIGGWFLFSARPVEFGFENTEMVRLTSDGTYFDVSSSPDGKYLIHSDRKPNESSLLLYQVATGSSSKLISYPNASFWAYQFTPDGNFVYYMARNWIEPEKSGVYRIPFLGGEAKLIYPTLSGGGISFSPDGKTLGFHRSDEQMNPEIVVMNMDGSGARRLAGFPLSTRLWSMKYSPDGESLVFVIRRENEERKNLSAVKSISVANGTETVVIPEQERVIHHAAWLPDRSSLLLLVREPNAELRQIWQYFPGSDEWLRVTNDNESYSTLNFLADGKSFIASRDSMNSSVWVGEGEPLNFRQVTGGINQFGRTSWTADGRLVYATVENKAEIISIMSSSGRGKQPLTNGGDGMWMQPSISADGGSILYVSSQTGSQQVWRMNLDGSGKTPITKSDSAIFVSEMLGDGKTLLLQKFTKPTGWKLFRQVGDGEPVPLLEDQISAWDVSPDDKQVAVWIEDRVTKKWSVGLFDLASGQVTRTLSGFEQNLLRWTPDGKGLAYIQANGDTREIRIRSLDDSVPEKVVTSIEFEDIIWFDWSRDGAKLVVVRGKRLADAVKIALKN